MAVAAAVGGTAGALATLLLLRYADTRVVGWLLTAQPLARQRTCWRRFRFRVRRWLRKGDVSVIDLQVDPAALVELEQRALADELAEHAARLDAQLSDYADHLAGNDPVLREWLRRFEGGLSS